MGRIEFTNRQRIIFYIVTYIVTIVAVHFMLPQNTAVDQYYDIGKPWSYDVMIAPMDFPIYKSQSQLDRERDSVQRFLVPYMNEDTVEMAAALSTLQALSNGGSNERAYRDLIPLIEEEYDDGIVSSEDKEWFTSLNITTVAILSPGMEATEIDMTNLRTVTEAYEEITAAMTEKGYSDETIKDLHISRFVAINLVIDKKKTNEAKKEVDARVLPTAGMMMKGEKIVDKGEVVTDQTAQVLESLQKAVRESGREQKNSVWTMIGDMILIAMFYALLWSYLILFRPKIFRSFRESFFLSLSSLAMIGLCALIVNVLGFSEYIVPFAMLPLVVRVFFDSRTALYVHIVTVLTASLFVANPAEFLVLELTAGMVAVLTLKDVNSRSQLVGAASIVFVVYILMYVSIRVAVGVELPEIDWWIIGTFLVNSLGLLLTYGIIFLVEKLFGFLSDVTLVELANVNNPLLLEFATKCPGTFQHVMQVSNLAVNVAPKIGANPLLVRAGAMYHDIGKMYDPMSFIENQQSGLNKLSAMQPMEAAEAVINHVTAGVNLAKKNKLPFQIQEFIVMHHGTSKVKYFYNTWKNEHPGQEPPAGKFCYAGPLPRTKETVLVMMADAIEAASRSLKEYNEETIGAMVDGIVAGQIAENQYADAPISFKDLETAKSMFKEELMNIYHSRIAYPKLIQNDGKTPFQMAKEFNFNFPRRFTKR